MTTEKQSRGPKHTTVLLCNTCKSLIMSKYSGQFVSCQCKEDSTRIFIDQTEHYARMGGNDGAFQLFNIEVDWDKTVHPFTNRARDLAWPYGISPERMLKLQQLFASKRTDSGDSAVQAGKAKSKASDKTKDTVQRKGRGSKLSKRKSVKGRAK